MTVSFQLDPDVSRDFPAAHIRFVTALGLRNDQPWTNADEALSELELSVADGHWQPFTKDHPVIQSWHQAYRQFGTNPNRTRPSVDALSRRLTRDGRLPRINSAVNAYNFVSVKFGTPAGAFDLDTITGPVIIRYGKAGDEFTPLGEPGTVETPGTGEVVYACGDRVLTRHWNHRDADLTKVTESSTNVVFIIERVSATAVPNATIKQAQDTLIELLFPHADTVIGSVIEPETPWTELKD